jgi:hypothetical protein
MRGAKPPGRLNFVPRRLIFVWNLFHVTYLEPTILMWLPEFWKIRVPLIITLF